MVSVNLPLNLIAQPAPQDLPLDWQKMGENILLRRYGDRFISDKSFLALRVPSVVLPAEFNYLINPHHPNFEALEFGVAEPFGFDERLRPEE